MMQRRYQIHRAISEDLIAFFFHRQGLAAAADDDGASASSSNLLDLLKMASSIHHGEDFLQSLPSLGPTGSALSFGLSHPMGPLGGVNRLGLTGDRRTPTSGLTGAQRALLKNLLRAPGDLSASDSTHNKRLPEQQSHMPWAGLTRLPSSSVDDRLASKGPQPPIAAHRPSSAVDSVTIRGDLQQRPDRQDLQQGKYNLPLPSVMEGGHGSYRGRPRPQESDAQDMAAFASSPLTPTGHLAQRPPLSLLLHHNETRHQVGSVFPQFPSFSDKVQNSNQNQAAGLIGNGAPSNIHPFPVPHKDASRSEQLDRLSAPSSVGAKDPGLPLRPPIMYRYDPSDRGRDRDSFSIETDDTTSRTNVTTTFTTESEDFDDTTTLSTLAVDVALYTASTTTPGGYPSGTPAEYSNDLPTNKRLPIILANTKPSSAFLGTRYPDILPSIKEIPFGNRTAEVRVSSTATPQSHSTKPGPANILSAMAIKARPPDTATGIDQPQASARVNHSQGEREATHRHASFSIDGAAEPPTQRALVHNDSYDAEWTEFPRTEAVSLRHSERPFGNERSHSAFAPSLATLAKQASHPSSQSSLDMADIQTSTYDSFKGLNAASTLGQQLKGFPPKVDGELQANANWTHLDAPWESTLRGHFASDAAKSSHETRKELHILPPSAFQPPDYSSSDKVPEIKGYITDVDVREQRSDSYRNFFGASVKDGRWLDGSRPSGVPASATRKYTGDEGRGADGSPAGSSVTLSDGNFYSSSKKGNLIEHPAESTQNGSGVFSWWYKSYNHSF